MQFGGRWQCVNDTQTNLSLKKYWSNISLSISHIKYYSSWTYIIYVYACLILDNFKSRPNGEYTELMAKNIIWNLNVNPNLVGNQLETTYYKQ